MNIEITSLLKEIENARNQLVGSVNGLSHLQVNYQPSVNEWSILQIVEHLVWAEQGGICGMFKAIEGIKISQPIWSGESANHGLSIEQIVDKTWQAKEKVPEVAAPRWGGSMAFWISSLENCQLLLEQLKNHTASVNLEIAIYPHPISGPLNIFQRLEFLRFHMERHLGQIERVKSHESFPA